MNLKKKSKILLIIALVLAFSMVLTGCRPSAVLEKKIYTADASEIDPDQIQKNPNDIGQKDDDFNNEKDQDSEKDQEETQSQGVQQNSTQTNPGQTTKYDSSSNNDKTSKTKSDDGDGDDDNDAPGDELDDADDNSSGDGDGPGTQQNEDTDPDQDSDDDGGDAGNDDGGTTKTITDGDGTEQKIPKNVKTVTATGYAAAMVEMLGGSGRLIGSDADFTGSSLAKTLCTDVAAGKVQTWWTEDGSSQIPDSCFQLLLSQKPQLCIGVSGKTIFSSSQLRQLNAAGIKYIVVPKLTSVEKLEQAADILAQCLNKNNDTGKNSASIANSYENWIEDAEDDVETSDSKHSVYINSWEDSISYSFTSSAFNYSSLPVDKNGKGSGVATALTKQSGGLVGEFMKAAGVRNEATSASDVSTDEVYVTPMFNMLYPRFSSSSITYYGSGHPAQAQRDWFVSYDYGSGSEPALLGSSDFPTIIVKDDATKSKILNSWYWQYHGTFEINGITVSAGYVSGGQIFYSSVAGDYDPLVNPDGLGNWAEGSVDSPLETYWVSYAFNQKTSKSTLISKMKDFYKTFFNNASVSTSLCKSIIHE